MANSFFQFKQFTIQQDRCAMKVTTDACLFGSLLPTSSEAGGAQSVLDIGTGTGLLALMFAQKNPQARIDVIEIDKDAAEQAKENVASSPWKKNINVINDDARTIAFAKKYDLIISNPPFYENELKSENEKKNLAHHSKNLILEELLTIIKDNLHPDGNFFLLLPYKRNEEIRKFFRDHQLIISKILFVRQSEKHDYFRIILKGKLNGNGKEEIEFDEISIWDEQQNYTATFIDLLKDYYLYL